MKIIILKNDPKIGVAGEVKEVSDGYARNYLIPNGIAMLATPKELARLEEEKKVEARKAENELKDFQEIAAKLDGYEIEIFEKVSDAGTLYSSLSTAKIAKALKEKGFDIDKKQIKISSPIKEVGEHDVNVVFEHGLEVGMKVIVAETL